MSKQSTQITHYHGTPSSFRREIEEQRELAEAIADDVAFAGNLFKTLFSKVTDAVKAVRVGNFTTRDAS